MMFMAFGNTGVPQWQEEPTQPRITSKKLKNSSRKIKVKVREGRSTH